MANTGGSTPRFFGSAGDGFSTYVRNEALIHEALKGAASAAKPAEVAQQAGKPEDEQRGVTGEKP